MRYKPRLRRDRLRPRSRLRRDNTLRDLSDAYHRDLHSILKDLWGTYDKWRPGGPTGEDFECNINVSRDIVQFLLRKKTSHDNNHQYFNEHYPVSGLVPSQFFLRMQDVRSEVFGRVWDYREQSTFQYVNDDIDLLEDYEVRDSIVNAILSSIVHR